METSELEYLKERVSCAAVLEKAGFAVDVKVSTRRAVKHRRGDDIVIVIHDGKGWFDPQSDAKGDVFSLIRHLDGGGFADASASAAELVGFTPAEPAWTSAPREQEHVAFPSERWAARRKPWPGSATWRYLRDKRFLPDIIIRAAIRQDRLREGPYGSMWAAHVDDVGHVTGWEERGPNWRGFSTGGAKMLFRLGAPDASRLCVTEAAIDAMSLAALEGLREGSIYLSTGGGWSPSTEASIRHLAMQDGAELVAATDNNEQGDRYAERLEAIADESGCRCAPATCRRRLERRTEGKGKKRKRGKERGGGNPAAACPPSGSRVKLRPASPALDASGRRGGREGGVRKAEDDGDPSGMNRAPA